MLMMMTALLHGRRKTDPDLFMDWIIESTWRRRRIKKLGRFGGLVWFGLNWRRQGISEKAQTNKLCVKNDDDDEVWCKRVNRWNA